jgi:hypothetical protein
MSKWIKSRWHRMLEKYYTRKMRRHKLLADYYLYRHNEAVTMYVQKREYRANNPNENGFFIAPESADRYVNGYNENWEAYINLKHKLDALNSLYE